MRLSSRKSWSQETLSLKRHLAGTRESGFLTSEKRAMLLLAVKTAMAAGFCYWLATLAHLQDGYWGSISAIIVLQSNVGSTVTASRDRLIGTLIGAAFGGAFLFLPASLWAYILAVITAMVTCSLLGLKNSSRLAGVTVTILMLVHRSGSNWTSPLHRTLEVLLGIVVALAFSTLIFPNRARLRLQDGLAQEFLLLGALFESILEGFRGETSVHLTKLRMEVDLVVSSNNSLREFARNEPSSGKASLEALSLISQYGMELQGSLHALELAIRDESGQSYAAHLEPEVGNLGTDIRQGFEYLAGCIHRWNFDRSSEDDTLESDIKALEKKMAEIRPTVLDFEQAEILRAYAVQLHLKQLAHLLHSVYTECSRLTELKQ